MAGAHSAGGIYAVYSPLLDSLCPSGHFTACLLWTGYLSVFLARECCCCCFCVKSFNHVQLFATPWTVCSPPSSSVHGILQARVLEWGAIAFSKMIDWLELLHILRGNLNGCHLFQKPFHFICFSGIWRTLFSCFPGGSDSITSAYNAGDLGLIPESGRSPGEGHGHPL